MQNVLESGLESVLKPWPTLSMRIINASDIPLGSADVWTLGDTLWPRVCPDEETGMGTVCTELLHTTRPCLLQT